MIFAGAQHRHLTKRTPRRNGGFSWGRFPIFDSIGNCVGVEYRLFRRDHTGALHLEVVRYYREACRSTIARDLRRNCRYLRDRVDEIDLKAWGIAA